MEFSGTTGVFIRRIQAIGIRDRPTSFRSPWQNGQVERLIGSIQRECIEASTISEKRRVRLFPRHVSAYFRWIGGFSGEYGSTGSPASHSATNSAPRD